MSEQRVVETVYNLGGYDSSKPNNNIIEQVTAGISDEQLFLEQIELGSNDGIHAIKDAYDNWDSMTGNEQKAIVFPLIICMLNLYKGQY